MARHHRRATQSWIAGQIHQVIMRGQRRTREAPAVWRVDGNVKIVCPPTLAQGHLPARSRARAHVFWSTCPRTWPPAPEPSAPRRPTQHLVADLSSGFRARSSRWRRRPCRRFGDRRGQAPRGVHHDLVGRQCQQRPAAHRIVGDEPVTSPSASSRRARSARPPARAAGRGAAPGRSLIGWGEPNGAQHWPPSPRCRASLETGTPNRLTVSCLWIMAITRDANILLEAI